MSTDRIKEHTVD